MIKYLLNTDGEKVTVEDALKGSLSESYPMAYIKKCIEQRAWNGRPSTTQLINGTRLEYLRILTDYAIDPSSQAFRILGTGAHEELERLASDNSMTEYKLSFDDISGIADCLEEQPNGEHYLIDYKTWGSFKVALALGLEKKKRALFDNHGNPVLYQKSGYWGKKGEQKQETYFESNPDLIDMHDAELQLNRYKIMTELIYKVKVSKMKLFCIIRDGGLAVAKSRGVERQTEYIDVKELDPEYINNYFTEKRNRLVNAIDSYEKSKENINDNGFDLKALKENCPKICNEKESWNYRRCEGYCPVSEICKSIFKLN